MDLVHAGADKVAVGWSWDSLELYERIADRLGSQAVVSVISYKHQREAWINARLAVKYRVGEIILQCMDRDGMMGGYDLETAFHVASSVDVPVVLSSGAGTYEHLYEGLQICDAVAAASMWHFTEQTPKEAKQYLKAKGVHVRIV